MPSSIPPKDPTGVTEDPRSSLSAQTAGARCRVVAVSGTGAIRQRLLDMGVLPGRLLEVIRVAPAAGPMWLRLGPAQLALRRGEAQSIWIELVA